MITIRVQTITKYAMFEQDGIRLREAICDALQKEAEVQLDFEGVEFFTTMFFNASIGWLFLSNGPLYIEEKIQIVNLTELGEITLKHSFENAKKNKK